MSTAQWKYIVFKNMGRGRSKGKFEQHLTLQDLNQSVQGLNALRPRERACRITVSETGPGMQLPHIEFTARIWVNDKEKHFHHTKLLLQDILILKWHYISILF